MQTEIMIAGFGGQGVLFTGELLARAAMDEGLHVTWFPSYGPEMRGGTANCIVIISDEEIGSPLVRYAQTVLAMNLPSFDKYEKQIPANGIMVVNASLVNRNFVRDDIIKVMIPASEIAEKIAERRLTNMVMLGAYLSKQTLVSLDAVKQAIQEVLPKRHHRLLPANMKAISEGYSFAAST